MKIMILDGKGLISWLIILFMSVAVFCILPGAAKKAVGAPALTLVGDQYFKNNRDGKMWTKERGERLKSSSDVKRYLYEMNKGEFNNWRLPTSEELYDLLVIFDLKGNGDVKVRIEGDYWLVVNGGAMSVGEWEIGGGCGPERHYYSGKKGFVRAVRP